MRAVARETPAIARKMLAALAALLLAATLGCGEQGPSCGAGTVEKNGACVLPGKAVQCGAGTELQGGLCLPIVDAAGQDAAQDAASDVGADGSDDVAADAGDATGDAADTLCAPDCTGKVCGSDGCGGSCGACQDLTAPICIAGACTACKASCVGKGCGDDGCGGSCGSCAVGLLCASGSCVAPPPALSCLGHCGSNAPGGCSCAPGCSDAGDCCADVGLCGCVPACTGKVCGDDGCGGSCGGCTVGAICVEGLCSIGDCTEATCNGNGTCALSGCSCAAGFKGAFCDSCAPGYVSYPACVTACSDEGDCADGEPCTKDECDKALGCVHLPTAATCSDGDPCSQGDACLGGACKALGLSGCDDANPCTVDACDKGVGCTHLPAAATGCDDGDACTAGDVCTGGACAGKAWSATGNDFCDDGNACSVDVCAAGKGCAHVDKGGVCSDGNPCTTGAFCQAMACVAVASKPCDDGNDCTVDACDAKDANCKHVPANASVACDDGDLCTTADACDGKGVCAGGPKVCQLAVTKGLIARYSAAQGNTLAYGADAKVKAWQDQGSSGQALLASDAAKAPTLLPKGIHGRPGLLLDGAAALQTAAFDQGSDATVAVVVCASAAADHGPVASHGGWTLGGKGAAPAITVGGATVAAAGPAGACHVVVARIGGTTVDLSRSATMTTFAAAQGTWTPGKAALTVGGGGATGVLGELLLWNRALSDDERDAVATYLRTAWGLPRPHPDVAFFDAADLATVVTSTAQTAPGVEPDANSALVEKWRDKSGHGRDATANGASAPTWFKSGTSNGRPAIRFHGAQVRLQTDVLPTSATLTLFVVCELDQPQALGTVVAQGDDAAFALRRKGSSGTTLQWLVGKEATAAELGYKLGGWQLLTARQDGASSLLYADPKAAATATAAAGIAAAQLPLLLGNGPAGGRSMGGFIAELQLFSTALSTTDRALVEAGLRVRFGL